MTARTARAMTRLRRALFLPLIILSLAIAPLVLVPAPGSGAPTVTLEFWTIALQPFFNDYINGLIAADERAQQ